MKVLFIFLFAGVCAAEYVSTVRQNYGVGVNSKIVNQITNELQASYVYQAYSHYFGRADVALPGFAKWFEKASKEEREHATGLIEYVNKRGGSVTLNDIQFSQACHLINQNLNSVFPTRKTACICYYMSQKKDKLSKNAECEIQPDEPDTPNWRNGLWAMQETLVLERLVNQQLLDLHSDASNDPHLSHVLEHDYLDEQVESIKTIANYVRQLERVGTGVGEYLFDKNLE